MIKKFIHKPHFGLLEQIAILSFLFSALIWLISVNIIVYAILILALIIKLIIFRHIKKSGNGIVFNKNSLDYKQNIYIQRSMNTDIQLIILSLVFYIIKIKNLDTDAVTIVFATYIIFAVVSYMLYPFKNTYIKTISIIISTPVGLIILMFFCIFLLMLIDKLFIFINNNTDILIPYTTIETDNSEIIASTLSLISLAEKDISFWGFSTIIFSVLNIVYIIFTPKYHLHIIKNSYNIVTVVASSITLVSTLFSQHLSKMLLNFVQDNKTLFEYDTSIIDYFNDFSETNMRNIITLILIPYSLGLIICNAFINFRINKANLRKEKAAKKLLTETDEKAVEKEKTEFLINGGKSVELDYIDQIRINSSESLIK